MARRQYRFGPSANVSVVPLCRRVPAGARRADRAGIHLSRDFAPAPWRGMAKPMAAENSGVASRLLC